MRKLRVWLNIVCKVTWIIFEHMNQMQVCRILKHMTHQTLIPLSMYVVQGLGPTI